MDDDFPRELGTAIRRWAGGGVGVVRLLDRHGFGTVAPGQVLAGTADGDVAGTLLAGVVDDVARPLAASAVDQAQAVDAQVAERAALDAGLVCAGHARLLAHPLPAGEAAALGDALATGHPVSLVATVDGASQLVVTWTPEVQRQGTLGDQAADDAAVDAAGRLLRRGATATERLQVADLEVLLDLWIPVPTLLVVGTGAIGDALAAQAELLGWRARSVTALAEAGAAVAGFTHADVLVLLDHAPEFDALLVDGLRHGRGFLGALGSRRTQAARRERLLAAGMTEADLAAMHAPVGLDIGARSPAETAVSICAEVVAAQSGRAARPLAATDGRIGSGS
ncbi:MAG: hypothetical protein GEV07_18095 [Streptosporangiales bacterium]|nr:hypothetical protein [Streptosporangiales bacterium]